MLRPVLPMDNPASLLAALQHRLYHQTPNRRGLAGFFVKSLAVLLAVIRDLAFGQLTLRATSLVYTTLLSIVPMLALTFSVSTAFGVRGQIEPALARFMEPLGPRGQEITTNIMNFINNMNVGVLGSVGLGMLLFTAVSTILKIEASINTIWHVKQMRSISQRISGYLCILLLGPILVFSALGLNATLASSHLVQMIISIEPFGHLAVLAGRLLPYVLVILLFLFLYLFMPNTRVRFMPALTSALVAGVCWQSAGWGFARFVAGSSQYTAIYSSLAIIIIFMIWLYVSWLVVLVGASVGFYMQHTECLMASPGEEPRLSSQSQDQLALAIMQTLGERYLQGSTPLQAGELAQRFHTPGYAIDAILEALAARGIVVRTDRTDPPGWIPGRDLGNITPWQVLEAVRHAGEIHPPDPAADDTIQTFFYAQDQMSAVLSTISFRDLLTRPAGSRTVLTPSLAGGGAGAVAASLQAVAASAAPVLPHAQVMGGVALPDEELGGGVGLRSTAQRRAALQQLERQAQREGRQATPAVRDPGGDWDAIPTGTGRLCATDAAAMASFPAVAAPSPATAAAASPATMNTTAATATTGAKPTTTTAATTMATTAAATTPTGMATTTAATTSTSMASPSTSGQRFPFVASPLFHPEGNDAPLTADTPVPDAGALGDKAGADPDVPVFATTLSDEGETLIAVPVTGILPPQREEVRKTPRPGISPRRPPADAPSPGNA